MAPVSRIALRLADLSHAQLLEIAAAGCEASAEVRNRADAILAVHKPLAQWAVEGVLLSSDLVPHLLAPLQLADGAAAAVCSQWADGWKATSEGRRRLTRVAFDFPQNLLGTLVAECSADSLGMAVIPGGDEQQLLVRSGSTVRILARGRSSGTSFELRDGRADIAASQQFLYVTVLYENRLYCLTHDGTEVASYEDQRKFISCPVLGPDGLLFCVLFDEDDETQDEIVALDAQTLQPRHRFGLSLLSGVRGMVLVGEELFVCDKDNDRLQVFSLAGEHRCSITGEWKKPTGLCLVGDRLYLTEEDDEDEDEEGELVNPHQGRRIVALSLQGETLQVYTNPVEGHAFCESLCYFDGKLLVTIRDEESLCVGVVALAGA
jgi:sugar lactone lactonase YvrE